jgi:2,4-dienoyl-CoA reductase-like NADH-dependent reductase (Old Yellow Enzyme family)
VHRHGVADAKIGAQLAHAGRKASTYWPFSGRSGSVPASDGGWETVGPGTQAFDGYAPPAAMTEDDIKRVIADFAAAATRAVDIGFDTIELHGAHGYLLHQFQSPLINDRTDAWGGDAEGRNRLTLAVIDAVRNVIPESMPLLLRISASDWAEGGISVEDSVSLAAQAAERGVDLVDVSSGGAVAHQQIQPGTGIPDGVRRPDPPRNRSRHRHRRAADVPGTGRTCGGHRTGRRRLYRPGGPSGSALVAPGRL